MVLGYCGGATFLFRLSKGKGFWRWDEDFCKVVFGFMTSGGGGADVDFAPSGADLS